MNKKEQKAFEELHANYMEAKALSWSRYDVQPVNIAAALEGQDHRILVTGWNYNAHTASVNVCCSSGHFHSNFHNDRTDSQGRGRVYATELDAWKALRVAVEKDCAKKLSAIDCRIEEMERAA